MYKSLSVKAGLTQKVVDTFIRKVYAYKDKRVEIEWNFSVDQGGSQSQTTYSGYGKPEAYQAFQNMLTPLTFKESGSDTLEEKRFL